MYKKSANFLPSFSFSGERWSVRWLAGTTGQRIYAESTHPDYAALVDPLCSAKRVKNVKKIIYLLPWNRGRPGGIRLSARKNILRLLIYPLQIPAQFFIIKPITYYKLVLNLKADVFQFINGAFQGFGFQQQGASGDGGRLTHF
jgi:hypothetical protein